MCEIEIQEIQWTTNVTTIPSHHTNSHRSHDHISVSQTQITDHFDH